MRRDVCVNTHPRELNPRSVWAPIVGPAMAVALPGPCLEAEYLGAPCAVAVWTQCPHPGGAARGGLGCHEFITRGPCGPPIVICTWAVFAWLWGPCGSPPPAAAAKGPSGLRAVRWAQQKNIFICFVLFTCVYVYVYIYIYIYICERKTLVR